MSEEQLTISRSDLNTYVRHKEDAEQRLDENAKAHEDERAELRKQLAETQAALKASEARVAELQVYDPQFQADKAKRERDAELAQLLVLAKKHGVKLEV